MFTSRAMCATVNLPTAKHPEGLRSWVYSPFPFRGLHDTTDGTGSFGLSTVLLSLVPNRLWCVDRIQVGASRSPALWGRPIMVCFAGLNLLDEEQRRIHSPPQFGWQSKAGTISTGTLPPVWKNCTAATLTNKGNCISCRPFQPVSAGTDDPESGWSQYLCAGCRRRFQYRPDCCPSG